MLASVYHGHLDPDWLHLVALSFGSIRLVAPAEPVLHVEDPDRRIAASIDRQGTARALPPDLAGVLGILYGGQKLLRVLLQSGPRASTYTEGDAYLDSGAAFAGNLHHLVAPVFRQPCERRSRPPSLCSHGCLLDGPAVSYPAQPESISVWQRRRELHPDHGC